jgi:hypothetical protein
VTLRLSDEERGIVLRTLKARLDALHAEMTQTDSPQFNIQLKRQEKITADGEGEQGSGNGDRVACGAIARERWPPNSQ